MVQMRLCWCNPSHNLNCAHQHCLGGHLHSFSSLDTVSHSSSKSRENPWTRSACRAVSHILRSLSLIALFPDSHPGMFAHDSHAKCGAGVQWYIRELNLPMQNRLIDESGAISGSNITLHFNNGSVCRKCHSVHSSDPKLPSNIT